MFSRAEIVGGIIVTVLFVVAAYISQTYVPQIRGSLQDTSSFLGMVIFVFILFIATVVAPVSALPLIPVASALWGPFTTGILCLTGWTTGAITAFGLARVYGKPLVGKFVNLSRIDKLEERIPQRHIFVTVLVLRITMPVDILSYAFGLFAPIKWKPHAVATVIGIAPFAFLFAYAGTLPIELQVVALSFAGLVMLGAYWRIRYILRG